MKFRLALLKTAGLSFLIAVFAQQGWAKSRLVFGAGSELQQAATPPATAPQEAPAPASQATLPPSNPSQPAPPEGSAPLRVMVDKSLLINTT